MPGCHCHSTCSSTQAATSASPHYRRALWVALIVNLLMFGIEIVGGMTSGSTSLWADAVDFGGDAANYGLSLAVLSMGILWRARTAWIKGVTMSAFGFFVLAKAAWTLNQGGVPEATTMGVIGLLALASNASVAALLYTFRDGDANMRSVWLCSRNDAIGNIAVMAAAAGVFGTGKGWPDAAVAIVMAGLALSSGWTVIQHARTELSQ